MRSLGGSCLKYLLFVFNILCFVSSSQIVFVGIFMLIFGNPLSWFRSIHINYVVSGSILCVTSCLAGWGAVSENPHMLITSAVLEAVLALFNIVLLIKMYAMEDNVPAPKKHSLAIILGAIGAVKIIGIALTSFMASIIPAERRRIQYQEARYGK